MSQPSVTAYFNTRKRQACDELRGKSKILLLERDNQARTSIDNSERAFSDETSMGTSPKIVLKDAITNSKEGVRTNKAVRNIQFDSSKAIPEKTSRPKARATRSRTLPSTDGSQVDIRDSFLKAGSDPESKKVPFEKKGTLSPKKKPQTPKRASADSKDNTTKEAEKEQPASGSLTPPSSKKLSTMERLVKNEDLSLTDIKNRINRSSRLSELKAITQRIANYDQTLQQLQKQNEIKKPQMQKFEKVELEIPVR